jgi:hypothetical protein
MEIATVAPKPTPRFERVDLPAKFLDLAHRRTQYLFHVMTWTNDSMKSILASAYLQGINDASDALENKAKREGVTPPLPLPFHC